VGIWGCTSAPPRTVRCGSCMRVLAGFLADVRLPSPGAVAALPYAGRLDENDVRRLFGQIASAVRYCHMNNVVHRDLKVRFPRHSTRCAAVSRACCAAAQPENILLSVDKTVKVGDFGLGNTVSSSDESVTSPVGTPLYSAPEILCPRAYKVRNRVGCMCASVCGRVTHGRVLASQKGDYNGKSADIWSMGVILYTLVVGQLPFPVRWWRFTVHICVGCVGVWCAWGVCCLVCAVWCVVCVCVV
jgi:serine/threonine protein kinase